MRWGRQFEKDWGRGCHFQRRQFRPLGCLTPRGPSGESRSMGDLFLKFIYMKIRKHQLSSNKERKGVPSPPWHCQGHVPNSPDHQRHNCRCQRVSERGPQKSLGLLSCHCFSFDSNFQTCWESSLGHREVGIHPGAKNKASQRPLTSIPIQVLPIVTFSPFITG